MEEAEIGIFLDIYIYIYIYNKFNLFFLVENLSNF
jgi:hypothetical protein